MEEWWAAAYDFLHKSIFECWQLLQMRKLHFFVGTFFLYKLKGRTYYVMICLLNQTEQNIFYYNGGRLRLRGRAVILQPEVGSSIPSLPHLHVEVSLGKMLNPELPLIAQTSAANRSTVWICVCEWVNGKLYCKALKKYKPFNIDSSFCHQPFCEALCNLV